MERTLVLIKPDGVQRGLVGAIIDRLERRGLKLIGLKMLQMDRPLAETHYAEHKGKPFFAGLASFITSGPLVALALEGRNAISVVRQTVGATDPAKASAGTIRGDFGLDTGRNLVHASDSPENASRELSLFFNDKELLSYRRDTDKWITES
ncbi:MAG: nucleoside-diphosphate kinase [Dehalococcoidia bacterium]|nr:nucleoside-diphosphate kinase [Dehalococcoidia bacterium]